MDRDKQSNHEDGRNLPHDGEIGQSSVSTNPARAYDAHESSEDSGRVMQQPLPPSFPLFPETAASSVIHQVQQHHHHHQQQQPYMQFHYPSQFYHQQQQQYQQYLQHESHPYSPYRHSREWGHQPRLFTRIEDHGNREERSKTPYAEHFQQDPLHGSSAGTFPLVGEIANVTSQFGTNHASEFPHLGTATTHFSLNQERTRKREREKVISSANATTADRSEGKSKKRQAPGRHRTEHPRRSMLTAEQIESLFHLPQSDAARKLGVSLSTLKRRFYELNKDHWDGKYRRWPYSSSTNRSRAWRSIGLAMKEAKSSVRQVNRDDGESSDEDDERSSSSNSTGSSRSSFDSQRSRGYLDSPDPLSMDSVQFRGNQVCPGLQQWQKPCPAEAALPQRTPALPAVEVGFPHYSIDTDDKAVSPENTQQNWKVSMSNLCNEENVEAKVILPKDVTRLHKLFSTAQVVPPSPPSLEQKQEQDSIREQEQYASR